MTYNYNEVKGTEQNKALALYAIASELSRIADALEKPIDWISWLGAKGRYEFEQIPPRTIPKKEK